MAVVSFASLIPQKARDGAECVTIRRIQTNRWFVIVHEDDKPARANHADYKARRVRPDPSGKDPEEFAGVDLMRGPGSRLYKSCCPACGKMVDRRKKPRATRILIVDDHAEVRNIVRGNLEQAGYVCEEASDGTDAVKKTKAFRPDLIVLDLALPKMNGFEVAMVLRRETPKIPIVVMTMFGDMGQAFSKAFGIKAIVDKSEGMTALSEEIRKALKAST